MSSVRPATVPVASEPQPVRVRTRLAADRVRGGAGALGCARIDRAARGAVAVRGQGGALRRAEPGPAGPLVLEAHAEGDDALLSVWGDRATPADAVERGLADVRAWVGLDDDLSGFADAVAGHPLLRRLHREVGDVRLSRLPRVGEAFSRAVLEQLVQSAEAHRSIAQVAVLAGEAGPHGLWCWPTPTALGATPAHALRRCGVSLRSAAALHAGALADRRLDEVRGDYAALDRRLRALPGVGVWTSAEVRLALGDADAVSVGDYNLPSLVGAALAPDLARDEWDDALLLELVAPFAPHRGRVIRLVETAARRRLFRRPERRAPRAAFSAHRYW